MRIPVRIGLSVVTALLVCSSAFAAGASKDLEKTAQVKAYRALLKTVDAGDYEAYKKGMAAETAKGMDQQMKDAGIDAKKGMEFLKAMSPTELKFTSLKLDGKKATLEATGKVGGEINYGTIEMVDEDGQWKVVRQSWTNKK
ncbi:MAG: hypothetical protein DMF54_07630 [Acidobacteria bacterium]|nr:MAG: hypothetical protein DMF54_07630 [Acidobacteriota bacterium]